MPVYEYECAACGHHFEEWQKITEAPIKTCPKCNKDEVQRLISQTAFQLKGGGWYKDLYSSSKSNGSNGSGGSKSESKSSGSGDSGASSSTSSGSTSSGSNGASSSTSSGSGTASSK